MDPSPDATAREAIPTLLETYGDRVYALGLRLCGDPDRAEDLVQETFLRALNSWDRFEGRSRPSTWLYTIASRACARMHRRRAGEPRRLEPIERLLPSGPVRAIQIPAPDDPEADAARREASAAVLEAVARLPLDFRLPFVLKEMVDMPIAEIAEALGLRPATVKTRIHRARLRIRRELSAVLPGHELGPPDHAREECLALLRAKQEALDQDAAFPLSSDELCLRCRSVFDTLDYGREICRSLRADEMPPELRRSIEAELAPTRRPTGNHPTAP